MEEEEYYDSIDDTEFEECRSFCNDNFRENDSDIEDDNATQIKNLVPFYTGNVNRSAIESQSNSAITFRHIKLKKREPLISMVDQRKNRSYLTMFYAKSGQNKINTSERTEATYGRLSPGSEQKTERNESDNKSFYENAQSERLLVNEGCNSECCPYGTHSVLGNINKSESETTMGSKLLSVSEAHFNSLAPSRAKDNYFDKSKGKYISKQVNVGELGGLGPNIVLEKLELLRKRQNYGKTVSEKNRMKIIESKIFRKLKQEIRESNKI